jgi:hypothetical protein
VYETIQNTSRTIQRRLRLRGKAKDRKTVGAQREDWARERKETLGGDIEEQRVVRAWTERWERQSLKP